MNIMNVDYSTKIPNNVNLAEDRQVLKALEGWHPGYIDWWNDMGPDGFQQSLVYLRTAYSVDPRGWAKFDYVKMPDYRWGILLAPQEENRVIPFGENLGKPAWQEVPGEHRATLRRLIVIQGDTEPASVEQQRHLGKTAPSLYDMRNVFQVNVEEGRHLWAMVYILQKYFGRDGREEAEELGLVTFALDDIDWDDEIRVFLEERTSFSPDGLTGMEANLRFVGPETMESKIFSRLTAWQNWIFQRPNAVGEDGALRRYGTGQKAQFDMTRV